MICLFCARAQSKAHFAKNKTTEPTQILTNKKGIGFNQQKCGCQFVTSKN